MLNIALELMQIVPNNFLLLSAFFSFFYFFFLSFLQSLGAPLGHLNSHMLTVQKPI